MASEIEHPSERLEEPATSEEFDQTIASKPAAGAEAPASPDPGNSGSEADGGRPVSQASDAMGSKSSKSAIGNLDFILDVPLELTVELGRTKMMIHDLLKLGQGSVVELSKLAGETLDILANRRLIARGEVVVVNEKYGIRITEITSPFERVERLR